LSSADGGVISNVAMTFNENWDADATSGISLMGLSG
jgi:hypothetical protein